MSNTDSEPKGFFEITSKLSTGGPYVLGKNEFDVRANWETNNIKKLYHPPGSKAIKS